MKKKFELSKNKEYENKEGVVVHQTVSGKAVFRVDVEKELEHLGWVNRIYSGPSQAGIYSYSLPMAKLIRKFKELVLVMSEKEGFVEMIFPRHYNFNALKAFGWTDNEKLKYELMKITPFVSGEGRSNYELFGDPVQCLGFYETLRVIQSKNNDILPDSLFPNGILKMYEDQGGWTLRNEMISRLKRGFATGFEFSGAELVWAGKKEKVYETRWSTLHAVIRLISQLELDFRIVIGGSCSRDKKYPNLKGKVISLYEIPTLDIELLIPQKEDTNSWIEIGGGDIAGTRLTDNFGLKNNEGPILSGCQGVGWQRITYGFLSQKGLDPEFWPSNIRKYFDKNRILFQSK